MAKIPIRKYKDYDEDYARLRLKNQSTAEEFKKALNTFFLKVVDTEDVSLIPFIVKDVDGTLSYEFYEGCFVYWEIETVAIVADGRVTSQPLRIQLLGLEKP